MAEEERGKWGKLMYGEPDPAEPEPVTERRGYTEGPPPAETIQDREAPGDPAHTLGYVMAIISPYLGLLVGLALIARDDRQGAYVFAWSFVSLIVWSVVAVVILANQ